MGAPKAITATAHKLARIIYSTLKYGQEYTDAGTVYYETQYRERALRTARRRARQLGYQLVPLNGDEDIGLGTPVPARAEVAIGSLVSNSWRTTGYPAESNLRQWYHFELLPDPTGTMATIP